MPNIDTVKTWFETGDYPTQAQFEQFFEWIRWKDDLIEINEVRDLVESLNELALPIIKITTALAETPVVIPAGYALEQIWIVPISNCVPIITSEGSPTEGDILSEDEVPVTPTVGRQYMVNLFCVTSKTIVFKEVPVGSTIVLKRRKII